MSLGMSTRSPSPSFGTSAPSGRSSPSFKPCPAPFLTSNPFESSRPLPRRLTSLQPARSKPYPGSAGTSRAPSPTLSTPSTGRSTPGGGSGPPKRPGAPHRSHSFCATTSNTTYALASATSGCNLSKDKRVLVAPPLERTVSSIGSRDNRLPPAHQMHRPVLPSLSSENTPGRPSSKSPMVTGRVRTGSASSEGILGEKCLNDQTASPTSLDQSSSTRLLPLPTIIVSSSTPPRPSLAVMPSLSYSSISPTTRSNSYLIQTPTTPHELLFGRPDEDEEGSEDADKTLVGSPTKRSWEKVEGVARDVEEMILG
ncbi:hypothetical protein IAU60_005549 [Kwoniella sp. DSM 27419]